MADTSELRIEITTGHCLGGVGNDVCPGDVLEAPRDLPVAEARKKIRMGYARIVELAPEPGPEDNDPGPATDDAAGDAAEDVADDERSEADQVTHGDPAPEDRDPTTQAPKRRGRPRAGGR